MGLLIPLHDLINGHVDMEIKPAPLVNNLVISSRPSAITSETAVVVVRREDGAADVERLRTMLQDVRMDAEGFDVNPTSTKKAQDIGDAKDRCR